MFRSIVFPGAIFAIFFSYLSAQPTISAVPPDELLRAGRRPSSMSVGNATRTRSPTQDYRGVVGRIFRNSDTGRLHRGSNSRHSREQFPLKGTKSAVIFTKRSQLRKEMCKAQSIKQAVKHKGCSQQFVINRFCYGQCNSFYIPNTEKQNIKEPAFKSCSFCSPQRYTYLRVTLRCHHSKRQRFKRVKVRVIKRCECMAIDANVLS